MVLTRPPPNWRRGRLDLQQLERDGFLGDSKYAVERGPAASEAFSFRREVSAESYAPRTVMECLYTVVMDYGDLVKYTLVDTDSPRPWHHACMV
jgi:hypothetical protein